MTTATQRWRRQKTCICLKHASQSAGLIPLFDLAPPLPWLSCLHPMYRFSPQHSCGISLLLPSLPPCCVCPKGYNNRLQVKALKGAPLAIMAHRDIFYSNSVFVTLGRKVFLNCYVHGLAVSERAKQHFGKEAIWKSHRWGAAHCFQHWDCSRCFIWIIALLTG